MAKGRKGQGRGTGQEKGREMRGRGKGRETGRKKAGPFTTRSLGGAVIGGVTLLDAVQQGAGATLFFAAGTSLAGISALEGCEIADIRSIGGAPVVRLARAAPRFRIAVGGQDLALAARADECALFEGLDTGFAERNGQSARIALEWLRYHVEEHGMEAALILDRAPPGSDPGFGAALRAGAGEIAGLKRLVLLSSPVALGRAGLPPEAHPFCAPDAPGKDRMDLPPPDPWAAPLGETAIYELARARFLARARAVMNIDLSDLLAPAEGAGVFARARAATNGTLALEGRHAYPWRIRKGQAAGFGDHHLVPFDAQGLRRRWCVAPARCPEGAVWRMLRVAGAEPAAEERLAFWRCMALRHPGAAISKIVPKSSLVEDPALLGLVRARFGARPVRMPARAVRPGAQRAQGPESPRVTIVTTMKNEGPFILEWLAFHRMIGITDFLVYTNDCTDGTDTLLTLLQEKGLVQHRENPFRRHPGLKPQHAALQAAEGEAVVQEADWLICMDVDEFINIKCGAGRLADLFAAVPEANMISLTWRLFGNSDIHEYRDEPVIAQFTRAAPELIRKPHQAWGFKTLYRNQGIFRKLGVHRPKGLHPQLVDEIRWVNGSGRPMPRHSWRNAWRSTLETWGYDLVQLNHYAVRSAESFLVKRDRGRVNHVERDQGLAYWFRMNNNAEAETSIHRLLPAFHEERARLMADPEIAAAHALCVSRHREKIAQLRARPDYARFYAEITGPRMEKLSRMHARFGANVFLAGPDCVPDEILARDPEEPFFFTVERGAKTAH